VCVTVGDVLLVGMAEGSLTRTGSEAWLASYSMDAVPVSVHESSAWSYDTVTSVARICRCPLAIARLDRS